MLNRRRPDRKRRYDGHKGEEPLKEEKEKGEVGLMKTKEESRIEEGEVGRTKTTKRKTKTRTRTRKATSN